MHIILKMKIQLENKQPGSPIHIIWGIFAIGLIICGHLIQNYLSILPPCIFKQITGIPCLTCGGTRSIVALSNFEIYRAFLFNPLVMLFGVGIMVFSFGALTGWIFKKSIAVILSNNEIRAIRIFIISLVVLDWAFLIFVSKV
jgi:hypothetical protein